MKRRAIFTALLTAAVVSVSANAGAHADGFYSYTKNGIHVCFGGLSCLFHEKTYRDRDANGVHDHRTTHDHRPPGDADGSDPADTSGVRDHRTQIRDHRN